MKKVLALLLILATLSISVSCDHPSDEDSVEKTKSKTTKTTQEITTKTTEKSQANQGNWKMGEFVDEFEHPTGNKHLTAMVYDGKFSNSATTNSSLYAAVQVTSNNVAIMLWEYGSNLVKGTFDRNDYSITVLDQTGKKHYFSGVMYDDDTRIYVSNSDRSDFLNILKKSGKISIYLEYSKYTKSTYLFTIETTGFSGLYSQLS